MSAGAPLLDWTAPFFDGWQSLFSIGATTLVLYPVLVGLIRLSGKRAVSKMNNFDWIVTVAVGSVLASATVFDSVTVLDACLAIGLLLGFQWGVTRLMTKSARVTDALISTPTLLVHKGEVLHDALRRERVSEAELFATVRAAGLADFGAVYAVVLESNAEMTVVPAGEHGFAGNAMADVPALSDQADSSEFRSGPPMRSAEQAEPGR